MRSPLAQARVARVAVLLLVTCATAACGLVLGIDTFGRDTSFADAAVTDGPDSVDAGDADNAHDAAPHIDADANAADTSVDTGASDGADGSVTTYHEMTNATFWSTFNMSTVNANASGFVGATFDGRYLYFPPHSPTGLIARYDTQATFTTGGSWATFDPTTVNAAAKEFQGAVFDGRYVYFVPSSNTAPGLVTRFDTKADFTTVASWSTFDVRSVDGAASGFTGATFDGRYIYWAPSSLSATGRVARFDTQANFTSVTSWSTFDTSTLDADATRFAGAVVAGQYVFFVPRMNAAGRGRVTRYDTTQSFASAAAWATFDTTTVNAGATGFTGGAFDGRYVYFVPTANGAPDGLVTRYDTMATFTSGASWSVFDTAALGASVKGFAAGAFDGRYIYFAPYSNINGMIDGVIARYDTEAAFASVTSWSSFDTATVNAQAKGFVGAAFDGRFIYLVPNNGGTVARFDAKTPPSLPKGYSGSFL